MEKKHASESGQANNHGFRDQVVCGQADGEDPVGEVVGGWRVVCSGQDSHIRPGGNSCQDRDAGGIAAEEISAERYPSQENG